MEEFRLTSRDKQEARVALLRYYSSECVAHGAYLVALAVGFFGLVEVTPIILQFAESVGLLLFLELFASELVRSIMLCLILSGFVVLIVYVLGRTIFWGYLAASILNVKPKGEGGMEFEAGRTTVTFLQQLHVACFEYVRKEHRMWTKLYALRAGHLALMWFDLFAVFLIISLILLYVP